MPQTKLKNLLHLLRRTGAAYAGADIGDAALMERFLAGRDEAAFAALLERHGPMVMGVCRRILGDAQAEDAFQATFLVLARRANSIRNQASLGSWLFGVARRIASKAKAKEATRRERERRVVTMKDTDPLDDLTWQELRSILDEEIDRLPEKLRAAVVLCHLEGKSYEQAAQELGCPKSTLASRMTKAHELLRGQLTRRGVALSAGALSTALAEKATAAPVTAPLVINATKAAGLVAAGKSIGDIVSAQAFTLAEEAMKGMIGIKTKLALLVATLCLVVGAGYAGYGVWVGKPPRPNVEPPVVVQEDSPKKDINGDALPAGAVARLGQDRWLHDTRAQLAAFLPGGKKVLTVNVDRTIRVFEFPSGKEVLKIDLPVSDISAAVQNGSRAALSNDGKTIATWLPEDKSAIRFHDVVTGKQMANLKLATEDIRHMVFSPDDANLACMTKDGVVRIWDWIKAKEVRSFAAVKPINTNTGAVYYAPDGKTIATALGQEVKLWNPATGAEIRTIRGDNILNVRGLAFSPDGRLLAIGNSPMGLKVRPKFDAYVLLVEAGTGKEVGKLSPAAPTVAFSQDGAKLYAGNASIHNKVTEWDVATGKPLRDCKTPIIGMSISASPDGKMLLVRQYGTFFFLDISGQEMTVLDPRSPSLVSLKYTPGGKSLLALSEHFTDMRDFPNTHSHLQMWDAFTGKSLGKINVPFPADFAAISPDGRVFAAVELKAAGPFATPAVQTRLIDTRSGQEIARIPASAGGGHPDDRMAFSPDGNLLAIGDARKSIIELYEVVAAKRRATVEVKPDSAPIGSASQTLRTMILSQDSKTFAARADPRQMGIWDTTTGQRIGSLPLPQNTNRVYYRDAACMESAAFSPDGRCLVMDMDDGTAALCELATAQARRLIGAKRQGPAMDLSALGYALPEDMKAGSCFAFSADRTLLARSGFDRIVHVYDVQTGRELATYKGHTDAVNAVAFAPDGKTVASASRDGTALIWDVTKIKRPATPVKALQPGDLEKHWQTLAEGDAAKAFDAIGDLAADPKNTVAFIKDKLKPAPQGELPDKRTSLLLEGEGLRGYRAVEVLERIGTPAAKQLLQSLADGAPGALLTTSAQAALKR